LAEFGFDLEDIRHLIAIVESRRLERLVVEEDGRMIEILGRPKTGTPLPRQDVGDTDADLPYGDGACESAIPEGGQHADHTLVVVSSPVVGVFYRSPSPDSAPFVEVGDRVEIGQTIGLIEAMKVFSEVTSESAGIVLEILAGSGQLIKQGEALMYLRPE
jgi:acetyl-CoA carboxylase biotin carboxyl carrier protein